MAYYLQGDTEGPDGVEFGELAGDAEGGGDSTRTRVRELGFSAEVDGEAGMEYGEVADGEARGETRQGKRSRSLHRNARFNNPSHREIDHGTGAGIVGRDFPKGRTKIKWGKQIFDEKPYRPYEEFYPSFQKQTFPKFRGRRAGVTGTVEQHSTHARIAAARRQKPTRRQANPFKICSERKGGYARDSRGGRACSTSDGNTGASYARSWDEGRDDEDEVRQTSENQGNSRKKAKGASSKGKSKGSGSKRGGGGCKFIEDEAEEAGTDEDELRSQLESEYSQENGEVVFYDKETGMVLTNDEVDEYEADGKDYVKSFMPKLEVKEKMKSKAKPKPGKKVEIIDEDEEEFV